MSGDSRVIETWKKKKKERKCRTRRKCSRAIVRVWFARVTFNNADESLRARARRNARCNSHWLWGDSFIPRKPRKGRKLGKNHRASSPSFVNPREEKSAGRAIRPAGRSAIFRDDLFTGAGRWPGDLRFKWSGKE